MDLVGLLPALDEGDVARRLSLSDWDGIVLDNRLVRFVYDADSTERPKTICAFATLQEFLRSRHARIQHVRL